MVLLKNIRPVTDFTRNVKAHIRRLKKSNQPEVLTVNGEAELVVMNTEVFQHLIDDAEETRLARTLEAGIEEAKRGGGTPARQAFAALEKRFASRRKKRG